MISKNDYLDEILGVYIILQVRCKALQAESVR